MKSNLLRATALGVAVFGWIGWASAQQPGANPAPGQAGDDPAMSQPQPRPSESAKNPDAPQGGSAALADAPSHLPSPQDAAKYNATADAQDKLPIVAHALALSAAEQQQIAQSLAAENTPSTTGAGAADLPDLQVSEVVPDDYDVRPLPQAATQSMPWTQSYDYVRGKGRIYLVGPYYREVVSIIEQ